jgi:serine/threonine protein kinase
MWENCRKMEEVYVTGGSINQLPDATLHRLRQETSNQRGSGAFGKVFRCPVDEPWPANAAAADGEGGGIPAAAAAAAAPSSSGTPATARSKPAAGGAAGGRFVVRKNIPYSCSTSKQENQVWDTVTSFVLSTLHTVASLGGPGVVLLLGVGVHIRDRQIRSVDVYMEDLGPNCTDMFHVLWFDAATHQPLYTNRASGFVLSEAELDEADALKLKWREQGLDARGVQLWFIASARALQLLHKAKVTHRDLKLENQIAGEAAWVRALLTGRIKVTEANFMEILRRLEVRGLPCI